MSDEFLLLLLGLNLNMMELFWRLFFNFLDLLFFILSPLGRLVTLAARAVLSTLLLGLTTAKHSIRWTL